MMKTSELTTVIHDYWQDRALRRKAIILMVLAALYILIIPGLIWQHSEEKKLSILKTKYQEFVCFVLHEIFFLYPSLFLGFQPY